MQDDYAPDTTPIANPPRRRRSWLGAVVFALLAFLLGSALAGYLVWHGDLSRYLPHSPAAGDHGATGSASSATDSEQALADTRLANGGSVQQVVPLEARLAMLEDRFSRLNFMADAASGNAARAEALLIAASARRLVERGEPLGVVADQLRLRFADAQPGAVDTIVDFASDPVTIDQLTARLEALTPDLTDTSQKTNFLDRTREEIASLFTVHSDSPTLLAPAARIDRARLMLTARKIGSAIDEVERLPGADAANKWIADAHRFDAAQHALDLLETTAMLAPRRLRDGSNQEVDQDSPLAEPAMPQPTASPDAPTAR